LKLNIGLDKIQRLINIIQTFTLNKYNLTARREYIVEIKPKNQITKPQPPKKQSKKALESYKFLAEAYIKNMDKYNAAKEFCDGRNYKFIVLTEDTILNGLR